MEKKGHETGVNYIHTFMYIYLFVTYNKCLKTLFCLSSSFVSRTYFKYLYNDILTQLFNKLKHLNKQSIEIM